MLRLTHAYKYQKFYERLPFKTTIPYSNLWMRVSTIPITSKEKRRAELLGFLVFVSYGDICVAVRDNCRAVLESNCSAGDLTAFLKVNYMFEFLIKLYFDVEKLSNRNRTLTVLLCVLWFPLLPLYALGLMYFASRRNSIYAKATSRTRNG